MQLTFDKGSRDGCVIDYLRECPGNRTHALLWALYLYYLSKVVELLDTIIFLLRKKDNQVTFLHVYHHATMPLLWWTSVKWVGGGESFCSPLCNSLVHVFMYAYYALAGIGPHMQPYLWWKKYITMMQLSQFYTVIIKTIVTCWMGCAFPQGYLWAQILYMASLAFLFTHFYSNAYKKSLSSSEDGQLENGRSVGGDFLEKTQ